MQQWDLLLILMIDYSYSYCLLLLSTPLILLLSSLVLIATSTSLNRNRTTTILHGLYLRQNQPTNITMFFSLSTLLRVLVASASIPFVAAQASETELTTNDLYGTLSSTAAAPGFNVGGGSVFTNFVNAFNDGQFFHLGNSGTMFFEEPGSEPIRGAGLTWCSDLTFSDISNTSLMGYAARCVTMFLAGYAGMIAAGAQVTYEYSEGQFGGVDGISAVFVEQLNVFQGQRHANTDDLVARYWDDGRKTMPTIAWEGHDDGDMSANAATSSWSGFGEITWMSVDEVAQLLNTSTDEFTPDKFKQIYEETWIKQHEFEEASDNPNAEAELEIIDEVKTEADSTDGGTVADDGSGTRRKLVSVAGRFVSAALRVFGI
jgi:hypothetical protein